MNIINLPPQTVDFINCVYHHKKGMEQNLPESLKSYRDFIARTAFWFDNRKQTSLTDEENTLISNVGFLLQKREEEINRLESKNFDTEIFEELIKTEFELGDSLTRLNSERERMHVSPMPVVNDFLITAWAHINKDAPLEAVKGFLPLLHEYLTNLEGDYNSIAHILKPEVKKEFSFGFEIAREALKNIGEALDNQDKKKLDIACNELKEGTGLLNYYIEWQKNQDEQLIQQFSQFKIPFVAHQLEILLLDGKEGRSSDWSDKIDLIRNSAVPELLVFWNQARSQVFVRPSRKTELVDKLDEGIGKLEKTINALGELTSDRLAVYEESLRELSTLFTQLEGETLRWNNLIGTGGELLGECVKGIYYGTLPDFTLRDITNYFKTSPLVSYFEEGISQLEAYLEDFNKDRLLWGLEKLLDALPQKAEAKEEAASTILCPFCGTANQTSRTYCEKCNARLMFKEAVMMEQSASTEDLVAINIMDLPLPSTAEPLVRLLHQVEKGELIQDEAQRLMNNFVTMVNQTAQNTGSDKLLSEAQSSKMGEIMEDFAEAARIASEFPDSNDPDVLRRALKKISDASVRAKKFQEEEQEKIARQGESGEEAEAAPSTYEAAET